MKTQTRQRAAIRGVLRQEERPMTAEEIYRLARKATPSLGLSTVYRSIRRMMDEQELVAVDFPGQPPRYELPTGQVHSHFICTQCEKVFDLPKAPKVSPVPLPKGFRSHGYEVIAFGRCAECGDEQKK